MHPTIFVGSGSLDKVEKKSDFPPPFYITLTINEKLLHNFMLDFGSSHNIMPKYVMESLGLSITRPYHDLFAFDSRTVQCLGAIKYLVVNLAQLLVKSVMMDVVVADIETKFGMLLSRSWKKRVGGTLQMDLSYATIPIFVGEQRSLYREVQFSYLVSDNNHLANHPIYSVE